MRVYPTKVFRPVTRNTLIFVFGLSVCGACVKAEWQSDRASRSGLRLTYDSFLTV